tara:strand:+ start:89 stop:280 length:192 start_codon:yes stop_codon:yes gene_type:complete
MSETFDLELTEKEIKFILALCESAQVAGIETAKTFVSLVDKIEILLENQKLPEGQTTLIVENE